MGRQLLIFPIATPSVGSDEGQGVMPDQQVLSRMGRQVAMYAPTAHEPSTGRRVVEDNKGQKLPQDPAKMFPNGSNSVPGTPQDGP